MVKVATQSSISMMHLVKALEDDFPTKKEDLHQVVQQYHQYRENLYYSDGVVLYNELLSLHHYDNRF